MRHFECTVPSWCTRLSVVDNDDPLPDLQIQRVTLSYVQPCEKTTPNAKWERDRAKFMYEIALSSHLLVYDFTTLRLSVATKQRFTDATISLLDIANESADAFPPLKSCLGGINALIKYYEVRLYQIANDLADTSVVGM